MYKDTQKVGYVADGGPQAPSLAKGSKRLSNLDPVLVAILVLAFALQLITLGRIEGYLLADSVEYMDRAQEVSSGGTLDPTTVRSFAFSALMVPIFWVADLLGLGAGTAAGAIRLLVMGLGLFSIVVVARTGTRLFGREAGLFAGALLAMNPTFLQYGVEPLSGGAALLSIALALEAATRAERGAREGMLVGLWSGVALLMAFKTFPISAVLLLVLVLRGRWSGRGFWLAALGTYAALMLLQCLLDLWIYGTFGSSLVEYLLVNIGSQSADLLLKLHGIGVPGTYDLAATIYEAVYADGAVAATAETVGDVKASSTGTMWYLERLTSEFLVLPAALAVGAGALLGLVRRRPFVVLIAVVLLANAFVLSIKSSKSFRLWQPLLPLIALLAGLGLSEVLLLIRTTLSSGFGRFLARIVGAAALLVALLGGQSILERSNLTKYGSWWQGIELLDAAAGKAGETWTYTSAYHWAVRFRGAEHLELTKLPHHMDQWHRLGPEEREEVLAALDELDGFLAHRQILTQDPEIMRRINARFEIVDILYEAATFEELDSLYVLKRRDAEPRGDERTFFELYRDIDPGPYQSTITTPHSVDYRYRVDDRTLQMVLLGWDLETDLAGGELAWLTLHWYIGDTAGHDYTVVKRLTDPDDRSLNENSEPAYGAWPTSQLEPGWVLRESYPLRLPTDPNLFGGANSRGDLVPCGLWIGIAEFGESEPGTPPVVVGGLNPFQPSGLRPIARIPDVGAHISPAGYRWSSDGLMQVGGLWLPVPRGGGLADDGRRLAAPSGN